MAGKSVTHSDKWWLTAPAYVLRCVGTYKSNGEQCRRVADDGSVVCGQHGGAAPQVRRRAAERIAVTAEDSEYSWLMRHRIRAHRHSGRI